MDIDLNNILMCWNMPREITEDLVFELFCNAGPIDNISFGKSGKSCFIVYEHADAVNTAKEIFKDIRLCGRSLRMFDHMDIEMIHQNQSRQNKRNRYSRGYESTSPYPQIKRSRYIPDLRDLRFSPNTSYHSPSMIPKKRQYR